eukprot:1390473-Amorphochlora_amoeboformis.AAC.1
MQNRAFTKPKSYPKAPEERDATNGGKASAGYSQRMPWAIRGIQAAFACHLAYVSLVYTLPRAS